MNVLVIGANGQIGHHVIKKLQEAESYTPIAMVRKEEQKDKFEARGVNSVIADLEDSIESIENAMKNVDAVVFTAGSGGHTGADKTMLIDLDGAVKAMKASKRSEVKRFVIVSAIGSHKFHIDHSNSGAKSYYRAAKYYADVWLENSGLDYTIIRPGILTNDEGTGQVKAARDLERDEIPREDVAEAIIASLENEGTIGKDFDMVGGLTPIAEALKEL